MCVLKHISAEFLSCTFNTISMFTSSLQAFKFDILSKGLKTSFEQWNLLAVTIPPVYVLPVEVMSPRFVQVWVKEKWISSKVWTALVQNVPFVLPTIHCI